MRGGVAILLVLILCCSCSGEKESAVSKPDGKASEPASETITIPLSEIWALDMPGTKDLRELLKDEKGNYIEREPKRLFDVARKVLTNKLPESEATKLFAVSGTGRVALAHASHLLRDESRLGTEPIPSNEEASLVFFAHPSSYDVQIKRVERHDNVFRIEYRFVPRYTGEPTIQLAIIPVGKLPVGEYPVEIVQLPMEKKYLYKGFQPVSAEAAKRIVCQPYTFQVYERPAADPGPAKDATVIPLDQIWALYMRGTKDVRDLGPGPYASLSIGPLGNLEQLMGKKKAGAGFVVPGTGREALIAARKKLPPGEKPPNELPAGTDVTVVYYSYGFSQYIVLDRVERQGNTINIRYRYDATGNESFSQHIALIPLGNLPVGKYQVNMIPVWDKLVEMSPTYYLDVADDVQRVVCKSFEFTITPEGDD